MGFLAHKEGVKRASNPISQPYTPTHRPKSACPEPNVRQADARVLPPRRVSKAPEKRGTSNHAVRRASASACEPICADCTSAIGDCRTAGSLIELPTSGVGVILLATARRFSASQNIRKLRHDKSWRCSYLHTTCYNRELTHACAPKVSKFASSPRASRFWHGRG